MLKKPTDLTETQRIIATKDFAAVEEKIVDLILNHANDDEMVRLFCDIFEADWHFRHEDMARCFQQIKNPITTKSLFNVAFSDFEYQRWNEYYPLQRKCTWALADIGTEEAQNYLRIIEQDANATISAFATKRLVNWENENQRKR